MTALSIIIPTYNGLGHLQRCLPSVVRYAPPATQVIVVDDHSSDETVRWIRRHFPVVEVLALPENRGFCAAVNAGIERARGTIVELLNNDTEVTAGWAEAALRHFADPTVGAVAPLVLQMDRPEIIDSAGQEYHLCGWATDRGHGQPMGPAYLETKEVFGASGSSGFYRRDLLLSLRGLNPIFGAYFEDTDLAFRVRWAGYRCIYEPASRVYHKGSASYRQQPARVTRLLSRNEELVWWINMPAGYLALGLLPHLGFLAIRFANRLVKGGLGPFVAGKWQAIRAWREICRCRADVVRLRADRPRNIDPLISTNIGVLRRGVTWLRHRKCA